MNQKKIALIGIGYVGLPLAVEFGKKFDTVGYDLNKKRIQELNDGLDRTLEVTKEELVSSSKLSFTASIDDVKECKIFIITVPTPINEHKNPDLNPLKNATFAVGSILKKSDIVIYESTVYPGATEEVCVPILEEKSGLKFNKDFFVGYSPERINPGDKNHKITSIKKVISGSTPEITKEIDELYREIINAGTHKVESIKIAEAAKVIENTQRDVNIALINELALIFNKLNIDTESVLKAAGTKWNFLPFRPGLVGGHCIGVDPYYLTYKAIEVGYNPEMILAGRRLNDSMGTYVADQVTNLMTRKRIHVVDARILIMGLAFKENCPDIRNSLVLDMIKKFWEYNCNVDVHDPWVDNDDSKRTYGIDLINQLEEGKYDAIIFAVAHNDFKKFSAEKIRSYGKDIHVLYDIKYIFSADDVDGRL